MTIKKSFLILIIFLGLFSFVGISHAETLASHNWSGYITETGNYTKVTGTWTIPDVPVSEQIQTDTTWVGIGGVNTQNLIQAGTDSVVLHGRVTYHVWYERLPDDPNTVTVPLDINPGDSITATITETSPNMWLFEFKNNTTGDFYSITLPYTSLKTTAEWIEEMPTVFGNVPSVVLSNFGTINFSNASAINDGITGTPQNFSASAVVMANAGELLAEPSGLDPSGASFSISRLNAPTITVPTISTVVDNVTQSPAPAVAYVLPGKVFGYVLPGRIFTE